MRRKPKKAWNFKLIILVGLVGGLLGTAIGSALLVFLSTNNPATVAKLTTPTPSALTGANARATLFARRAGTPGGFDIEANQVGPSVTPGFTIPALTFTPAPTPTNKPDTRKVALQLQLTEAWASYRQQFIQGDGRVIDPQAGGVTTSEGQSYALLRSVWVDDREVFDRVLNWTQNNLQTQPNSKLFSYKWGKAEDNSWRVLDEASASDADSDIALALIFAARRWNERKYQSLALEILASIWDKDVVRVQGRPYLTPGEWATHQTRPALNPSYLSPYAMRIFAKLDPAHTWLDLVDTSYEVIRGCSDTVLDGINPAKLPANWCGIDRQSGKLTVAQDYPTLNINYGYDAFRTMWRVALDYKWFGEKRALDYLSWSDTLRLNWKQTGWLAAEYAYDGNIVQNGEDLAVYGGDLANFLLTEPALADALVDSKFLSAYKRGGDAKAGWGNLQNYYTQNWAWFGLALYLDQLPNLTNTSAAPAFSLLPTAAAVNR